MRYNVPNNTPDDWEIVEDENGEFASLKDAKKYLIGVCRVMIEDELAMIKEVKNYGGINK